MRKILTTTLLASSLILSSSNAFAVTDPAEVSANNTAGTAAALKIVSDLVGPTIKYVEHRYREIPAGVTAGGDPSSKSFLSVAGETTEILALKGDMNDYIKSGSDNTQINSDFSITITLLGQATQTGTKDNDDANNAIWYGPQYMGGAKFKFIPTPNKKFSGIASWSCITTVDYGLTNPVAEDSPSRVTRMQSQMDGTSSEAVNLHPVLSSCIYVGQNLPS